MDVEIDNTPHAGKLINEDRQAQCKCGWTSKRHHYPYEALKALYGHYRTGGSMTDANEIAVLEFLKFGEFKQARFRHLLSA